MEADPPVVVEYSLIERGVEPSDVLADLGVWARRWGGDVSGRFDSRLSPAASLPRAVLDGLTARPTRGS